ncbi:MAG: SUMF1/EgtB/PvdO family nonheme iron enzyme, partial [Kiritimatiellae bacterium]|nr:SUMF1/EgtB/PvdO family nonheme iron enzyme [Kiritimatiellia bacterium]
ITATAATNWAFDHWTGDVPGGSETNNPLNLTMDQARAVTACFVGDAGWDETVGLLAYYPFDGNANDESGNGHHGTVQGAALTADVHQQADSAYSFDGASWISLDGSRPLNGSATTFAFSVWIKPSSPDSGNFYEHHGGFQDVVLSCEATQVCWLVCDTSGAQHYAKSSELVPGEWTHVVGTYDGAVQELYINTALAAVTNWQGPLWWSDPSVEEGIGGASSPTNNRFAGVIDEVRVYDRALTGEQVEHLYQLDAYPGMARIAGGAFQMGDNYGEGESDELPVHTVWIDTFFMDRTEVPWSLWEEVYLWATNNGYAFDGTGAAGGTNYPVTLVTWYDCLKWCNARSEKEGLTPVYMTDAAMTNVYRTDQVNLYNTCVLWNANGYRLPSEAEWEKAARGGATGHHFPWPSNGGSFSNHFGGSNANYSASGDPYDDGTTPCGYYDGTQTPAGPDMANGYGLYDMAGNVWEWCWDWYGWDWYGSAGATNPNPHGPFSTSPAPVERGGSWSSAPFELRCASRNYSSASFTNGNPSAGGGFRTVRAHTGGDSDGDGMDDTWEIAEFGDTGTAGLRTDFDGDGLLDPLEYEQGTDPAVVDTDMDGFNDYVEVINTTCPTNAAAYPSCPYRAWTRIIGTTGADQGRDVDVDAGGNVYITGETAGSLDGQPHAGSLDAFLTKFASDGTRLWTRVWGSTADEHGRSLSICPSGSVYVAGFTSGSFDGQTNAGSNDAFLTKYLQNGTKEWTRIWGSTGQDAGNDRFAVTTDSTGDVYFIGDTYESLDGQSHAGGTDPFLVKYAPDGTRQWTRLRGSSGGDYGDDVATDGAGNVYVSGHAWASIDGQSHNALWDFMLLKYATDGSWEWTRLWGSGESDQGLGCIVVQTGDVYVAGCSGASVDSQPYMGEQDAVLTKYASDGTKQWTRMWGSILHDHAYGLAAGPYGNVYVVGDAGTNFEGQATFGGDGDLLLTKFASDGTRLWHRLWGSSLYDNAQDIVAGPSNDFYVVGTVRGAVDGELDWGNDDIILTKWVDHAEVDFIVAGNPGERGAPAPYDYGTNVVAVGATIAESVATPADETNGTRWACAGWTGTGSVPAGGPSNAVEFTLATNSTLTWLWAPEYFLDTGASGSGAVDVADGWYTSGTNVTTTATPAAGWYFASWAGDVPDGSATNNPLLLAMEQARSVTACFLPVAAQVEQCAKITPSDPAVGRTFGYSVGISGDYALAGAPSTSEPAAYVFVRQGTNWVQQQKIAGTGGTGFGSSVAIDGDYALIGAPSAENAHIYVRDGTNWLFQATLTASDGAGGDAFGQFVALSGGRALVASRQDDGNTGSAYVFVRDGTNWTEEAKLTAFDGAGGDFYGYSVAIDGDYAVAGSIFDDSTGSAYVYRREGTNWVHEAKLLASDGAASDEFGFSVGISGPHIVVGARTGNAAYLFWRDGTNWTEQAIVAAEFAGELFGEASAMAVDLAIVGARGDDTVAGDSGAAYVYMRSGTNWTELSKLKAADASATDFFGIAVDIDGCWAVVGAYADADQATDGGSAYIFQVGPGGPYNLVVSGAPSTHGAPAPYGYGTNVVAAGTTVTDSVATPADETNGTRWACAGWTGTGDVPAGGPSNTVEFTIMTNSTLTWLWEPEYFLDTGTSGSGTVNVADGWWTNGSMPTITATAATN